MYFDSHAHFASPEYDADREAVLTGAFASGVDGIIEVGTDPVTWPKALNLARRYEPIFAAIGLQPFYAGLQDPDTWHTLCRLAREPKIVAIGEIGLDYHYKTAAATQREMFIRQLDLARELGLPVSIHHRDAEEDMAAMMEEGRLDGLRGVFHCFSGTEKLARLAIKQGFYISLAGPITFKNFKKAEMIRNLPTDSLLIETDAPYLAPEPFRGQRNRPEYITYTAKKLAEICQKPVGVITAITRANARNLFHVS